MKTPASSQSSGRRRYLVAVVLGTTLSALGTGPAQGAPASEATVRAVNDISRYCTACWRNARLHPDVWTDCTQEVFTRLMERVNPDGWSDLLKGDGDERRELVRAIDTVKKRSQRGRKLFSGADDLATDRRDLDERRRADDRAAVKEAAQELLSARQQKILQMSFEGWSVQDIAGELKLPAERISDEKYKAIRKLREHLEPAERDM
jgi:RNA polymerase sigma factor (sigma-70 family)